MFDLSKDEDKHRGIPPYANEHYGVHQLFLGWQSNLTMRCLRRGSPLVDPKVKQVLNGRIMPWPNFRPTGL